MSEPDEKRYVCEIQVSRGSAIADELESAIDRKQPITVVPSSRLRSCRRRKVFRGRRAVRNDLRE